MIRSNAPAARDIPAGKILIAEAGDVNEGNRAQTERIASAWSDLVRAEVDLSYVTPGFEIAGSVCRWTNGYWAVRWQMRDGTTHGRRYQPTDPGETEARSHFGRLTSAVGA